MVNEEQRTPPPRERRRTDDHDNTQMTTGLDRDKTATGSTSAVICAVVERAAGRGGARS
jgi:hypothetical protein